MAIKQNRVAPMMSLKTTLGSATRVKNLALYLLRCF